MKYIYYIIFTFFIVACSYQIRHFEKDELSTISDIKKLYYMGTKGLVLEVSSDDLFQSVTIKDNFQNKFFLIQKKFSKNFCFENDQDIRLCFENNLAILTENSTKTTKLVLISVEK